MAVVVVVAVAVAVGVGVAVAVGVVEHSCPPSKFRSNRTKTMSITIAEVGKRRCVCGEIMPRVYVDLSNCDSDAGLTLKQEGDHIDLTPQMVADLADALIEYQNTDVVRPDRIWTSRDSDRR